MSRSIKKGPSVEPRLLGQPRPKPPGRVERLRGASGGCECTDQQCLCRLAPGILSGCSRGRFHCLVRAPLAELRCDQVVDRSWRCGAGQELSGRGHDGPPHRALRRWPAAAARPAVAHSSLPQPAQLAGAGDAVDLVQEAGEHGRPAAACPHDREHDERPSGVPHRPSSSAAPVGAESRRRAMALAVPDVYHEPREPGNRPR